MRRSEAFSALSIGRDRNTTAMTMEAALKTASAPLLPPLEANAAILGSAVAAARLASSAVSSP